MKSIIPISTRVAGALMSLSLVCALPVHASDATVDSSDQTFMKDAAQAGMAEIKAGEMAKTKSSNAEVKAFGKHMVTDHTKASEKLKALAAEKKVELPTSPSMMQQGKAKLLDLKSGADFDKAYAEAMVSDHKTVVAEFKEASNEAKDSDVKAFASKTLPTLEMHLKMAEELQQKVGK